MDEKERKKLKKDLFSLIETFRSYECNIHGDGAVLKAAELLIAMMAQENTPISEIPTASLVGELRKREGVETTVLPPDATARLSVGGPATVLTVID